MKLTGEDRGRRRRPRTSPTRSASAATASTCTRRAAATTTSTSSSLPFQIPLGALIPQRVENLLPACKNIGTTHITNGCYRLHPVEWNIGEAAGLLAAFCAEKKEPPRAVRNRPALLKEFQQRLTAQDVLIAWPRG